MSESLSKAASAQNAGSVFEAMVESVGIKSFAGTMGLSTRQIHRMLNGAQPNPVERFIDATRACEGLTAQAAVDFICMHAGGHFVPRLMDIQKANVNAVKESAAAIVAISENRVLRVEIREIREAISALAALERLLIDKEQAAAKP